MFILAPKSRYINIPNISGKWTRQQVICFACSTIYFNGPHPSQGGCHSIRNLLSNAIKFTPDGGRVSLDIKQYSEEDGPDCYEVTVSDSGIGIPKERLDQLFRMDNTSTTKGTANESGTGLGLLLCYDFVIRNHGNLRAESETGKGSNFIFTLPAII